MEKRYLVGITGASGIIYAYKFLEELKKLNIKTEIIITEAGKKVWEQELGMKWEKIYELGFKVYQENEISAPPASGSSFYDGMIIIPCSMGTLSAIAQGTARNLLQRAADVMLKERKRLVLVIRETPLNLIHIKNMEICTLAGATIFPAMPSFYHKPKNLEELVSYFIKKLLKFLELLKDDFISWEKLYLEKIKE